MREPIIVDGAMKPHGQYSRAVIANGGFVHVSGQVCQTLCKVQTILKEACASLTAVLPG